MNLRTTLVAIAISLPLAACGKKSSSQTSTAEAAEANPGGKGLAAAPPKIAAAVTKVLTCKSYETAFDSSCADYKAWAEQKDDFNDGKSDGALVSLLEDANEKVRYLGAQKLNQWGKVYKTDKALATRILAAAEAEKARFAAYELGSVAGRIRASETGLFDRQAAIVKGHALPDLRRGMLANYLYSNNDNDKVFDLARATVKDRDKYVALAALTSFWGGGSRRPAETCQLYADNIDNPVDDIAAEASNALPWYRQCASKYDALLASLTKREKADKVPSSSFASALRHICEAESKATDAQRKKAEKIAKKIAESKPIAGYVRASAIDAVITCDPSGEKAFLKKMAGDADPTVKKKAEDALAGKK